MPWFPADDGNRLWYEDHGSGLPVVFIHGWCMSSAVWRLQIAGLSGVRRVIALDLRGHGQSQPYAGVFDIKGCALDVAGLLDVLDLHDVLLAGWSLGSLIALEACQLSRERLAGLVVIAGTPKFVRSDGFPFGLSREEADGMDRKVRRSMRRALDGFTTRMFAAEELSDPARAVFIRDLLSTVPLPSVSVAVEALQALVDADMRDRLAAVDLPTLVLNGDSDLICLPEASRFISQRIARARQVLFEGCGHAPFLTESQRFNSCVQEFQEMVTGERSD